MNNDMYANDIDRDYWHDLCWWLNGSKRDTNGAMCDHGGIRECNTEDIYDHAVEVWRNVMFVYRGVYWSVRVRVKRGGAKNDLVMAGVSVSTKYKETAPWSIVNGLDFKYEVLDEQERFLEGERGFGYTDGVLMHVLLNRPRVDDKMNDLDARMGCILTFAFPNCLPTEGMNIQRMEHIVYDDGGEKHFVGKVGEMRDGGSDLWE